MKDETDLVPDDKGIDGVIVRPLQKESLEKLFKEKLVNGTCELTDFFSSFLLSFFERVAVFQRAKPSLCPPQSFLRMQCMSASHNNFFFFHFISIFVSNFVFILWVFVSFGLDWLFVKNRMSGASFYLHWWLEQRLETSFDSLHFFVWLLEEASVWFTGCWWANLVPLRPWLFSDATLGWFLQSKNEERREAENSEKEKKAKKRRIKERKEKTNEGRWMKEDLPSKVCELFW